MKTYEEVLKESEKLLEYFKDDSLIGTIRKLKNGKHCEVYPLS
jgi:3-dehydroquinate dehydratase